MDITIEHRRKKYKIAEPTIKMWSEVMMLKDLYGEEEMYLRLLEKISGISRDELVKTDAKTIRKVGEQLQKILNHEHNEFHAIIEHNGKKYTLVDINKITFGQFVDIDTFLQKDEQYRISNLNELATYLYTEVGVEYGDKDFKKQIKDFEELPVKYIEGSIFFLSILGETLLALTQLYSQNKAKWWMMKTRILFQNIGVGIQQLVNLPKTKFGRLIMWCLSPLWLVSTILLILWTLIKNKKRK